MIKEDYISQSPKKQIIDIIRRSLGYIDRRLVDHGERVAYIAQRILDMDDTLAVDREKLLILCLLHDIGAYKTEEIDNMVCFETGNVAEHSVYGYVFLRNTTSLGAYAEAILYHHTDHEKLAALNCRYQTYAELIFLADRLDILIADPGEPNWDALRRLTGRVFSPHLVELFFAAEKKFDITGNIRDRSYRHDVLTQLRNISLTTEEIKGFLQMLVFSIDFRSPDTVTHTANTTSISNTLAQLMGLDDTQRRDVAMGAFLHDIGKIAIPYAILENPGQLDAEQMAIMRDHVVYSEEILRGVVSDEICCIAVAHHEKLNGSGYHHGLSAEQLSPAQRIVAVADIMSALIGRRSYKQPFSKEKTLSILQSMSDSGELCPRICALVRDNYDYIISVIDKCDDPVIELYEKIRRQYDELHAKFVK